MQVRSAAVLAAVTATALAAPAVADAATVSVPGTCFISSQPITVRGSGFTPGGPVTISGDVFGSTVADGAGNIAAQVSAPVVSTIAPKRVAVTVTDATNPASRTGAFVPVIRGLFKEYRFGKAAGPCGTLTVRARRVPIAAGRLHSGTWTLQLDQRRHYQRSGARRVIRFRLFRTVL
jgi:hypothetical protein